ncbi:MAG: S8 family serine peptidase [Chloroflexota bacterium]
MRRLYRALLLWLVLCCITISVQAEQPESKGLTEADDDATSLTAIQEIPSATQNKISPKVLKQLLKDDWRQDSTAHGQMQQQVLGAAGDVHATYLVFLHDRADLQTLHAIPDKETRRTMVVDRLQNTARRSQAKLLDHLAERTAQGKVARYTSYWIFNGLVVESDLETVLELARRPEVKAIRPNRTHRLPEPQQDADTTLDTDDETWNVSQIQADRVWDTFDITGKGIVVANMDSGVDWTHPALQHKYRGYDEGDPAASIHDYNWFDPTGTYPQEPGPNIPNISNLSDHGTHTMGTMVGSEQDGSHAIGVAPGAQWIAAKVFDDDGSATDEWIHAGFQWCLAPTDLEGQNPDPGKAPDIVNNSWGDRNSLDETFRQDLEAWRAAGILSVWSAGNDGPDDASISSPAGMEAAFAVGAVDANDNVASFSSRGPSPWVDIKPDVVAPGVGITSSIAGGAYKEESGTSMATPHAAGLAALLWEAMRDSCSITSTEQTIISTTIDLGTAGPDTAYGYGRIDAYQAVATVMRAGTFAGHVTDKDTGSPIEGATVSMYNLETGGQTFTTTDEEGFYSFDVAEGSYDVTVTKFGYAQNVAQDIEIRARTTTQLDFTLDPLPTGTLSGRVTAADDGEAVSAMLELLNTPLQTSTDAQGDYTFEAPVGTYTLRAIPQETGHRGLECSVEIEEEQVTSRDLSLSPAPHLLLVDADAWSTEPGIIGYYEQDLYGLLYPYDLWSIDDKETDVPDASELSAYDIVIWAQPQTSPGYIDAWESLGIYLSKGGSLLISGQDIGYWDQGASHAPEAYQQYLGARYLQDDSALTPLFGMPGTPFEGHGLIYNTNDSAGNQEAPDAITPTGTWAEGVMTNELDTVVGVYNDDCTSRTVYLGFGLEGVGPADARRGILDKAIETLCAERPARDVRLSIAPTQQGGTPGSDIRYNLSILNRGTTADTYELFAQSPTWNTVLIDPSTGQTMEDTGSLQPCEATESLLEISVPRWAAANDHETTTIEITSTTDPEVKKTQTIETTAVREWRNAPEMPTPRYRLACAATECALYAIGGYDTPDSVSDAVEILDLTSNTWKTGAPKPTGVANAAVVSTDGLLYTLGGYNAAASQKYADAVEIYDPHADTWHTGPPLPEPLSGVAATALQGQVYALGGNDGEGDVDDAYVHDPVSSDWTSIAPLPTNVSFAQATSLNGQIYLAGGWPDRRDLFRYDPDTDTWQNLAPMRVGRQSFAMISDGRYLYVAGGGDEWNGLNTVERYDPDKNRWIDLPPLRSAKRAGSAGAYVEGQFYVVGGSDVTITGAAEYMDIASPLTGSYFSMEPTITKPGETVNCSVVLRNPYSQDRTTDWTHTLPIALQYVEGSASDGIAYDEAERTLHWSGTIPRDTLRSFTFQAKLTSTIASETTVTGKIYAETGACAPKELTASTQVFIPSLEHSHKTVAPQQVAPGDILHYTVELANTTPHTVTEGSLIDPIPEQTTYVSDSVTGAAYDETHERIVWDGSIPPARQIDTEFAWIDAAAGEQLELGDDDCTGPLDLGFDFTFYEDTYSQIYVNSNGMVLFEECDTSYNNTSIPNSNSPNNFVAPFWDDLKPEAPDGAVYFMTSGQEPTRYAVVQWDAVDVYGTEESQTFQVILYEETNSVVFQYLDMTGERGSGSEATVGLENKQGTKGVQHLYNGFPSDHLLTDRLAFELEHDSTSKASTHLVSFEVRVDPTAPPGATIRNTAHIEDGWDAYERTATSTVHSPDLTASTKKAQPSSALSGETINYTLEILNSDSITATNVTLVDALPSEVDFIPGSLTPPEAMYDEDLQQITWQGSVPPDSEVVEIGYQARVAEGVAVNTTIQNEAILSIQDVEMASMDCQVMANEVDLRPSQKTASVEKIKAGASLTYTINLHNAGRHPAEHASLTDTLPMELELIEGTLQGASYNEAERTICWSGPLNASEEHEVSFEATVSPTVANGTRLTNVAIIDDGYGNRLERAAPLTVRRSDLSNSTMTVSRDQVVAGATVTYTVGVHNTGEYETTATLTCIPPEPLTLTSGYASAFPENTQIEDGMLTWQGTVEPHTLIVVRFEATTPPDAVPQVIVNEALLADDEGLEHRLRTPLTIESDYTIHLPLVCR